MKPIGQLRTVGLAGALLALAFVFAGCQHEPREDAGGLSGEFILTAVDGKAVPAEIRHGKDPIEVRSGSFIFRPDGSCGTETVFIPPSGKEVKRNVSATYTHTGTNINMQWKGAGRTKGVLADDTFTMNNEGTIFVYRKQ